jgi:hypothetical protein
MAAPQKYRDEAMLLREKAMATKDSGHRETILEIARLYDRLADETENQAWLLLPYSV